MIYKTGLTLMIASVCLASSADAWAAGLGCGDLKTAFGPFDYRTATVQTKDLVETTHFLPKVEMLKEGSTSTLGGDIAYTLAVFPNSPRALLSIARLGKKKNTEFPSGVRYSVECYFDRAIRFVPDDPMPHLIYAIYLKDRKRNAEAGRELDQAEALQKKEGTGTYEFDYNVGLVYADIGMFDKAVVHAKRAYELGAPFPGLKAKLKAAGRSF